MVCAKALLIEDSLQGQLSNRLAKGQEQKRCDVPYPVYLVGDFSHHDRRATIATIEDTLAAGTVVLVCGMTFDLALLLVGSALWVRVDEDAELDQIGIRELPRLSL